MEGHRTGLDEEELAGMLTGRGKVSGVLEGFEHRPEQVEMVRAVARAFSGDRVLVVEAGTGVGKSLAYGLPAAMWARQAGQRVVISSATINLQEQLVHKDLPLVGEVLGGDLTVVLVKGRANYLCRRRLQENSRQLSLSEPSETGELLDLLNDWAQSTSDGSRSDLDAPVPEQLWEMVCSDADACLGGKCPILEECFFRAARRQAERADVLVVNHHLLFADLALRRQKDDWSGPAVLPAVDRLILDEAHELEDAASSFFGVRITRFGVMRLLSRLQPPRKKGAGLLSSLAQEVLERDSALAEGRARRLSQEANETVAPMVQAAREEYRRAFENLSALVLELSPKGPSEARVRITETAHAAEGWTAVRESFSSAAMNAQALAVESERLVARLVDFTEDEGRLAETRSCIARLKDLAQATAHLISETPDGSVRWAEVDRRGRKRVSFISAPLDVSGILYETLFERMSTVVLTSATLSVGGSFEFLCGRLGADRLEPERVITCLLESPFDFASQVRLCLPTDLPSPTDPRFEQVVPEAVYQAAAVSSGRALVLFTSWGLMSRVHELVRERLEELGLTVLCQGQMPRDRLLNRFRENEGSVLLGTDSFWQGVDVIGPALSNVIITRLPFDVPDEPLVQARMEAIQQAGRSPFREFMLPRAVLKLKQGFGRLIRSRNDWGAVILLDGRLLARSYGKRFIESLPRATRLTGSLEEVCDEVASFFSERGLPALERITRFEEY